MTKFRAGALIGLAAGYYLGARAGTRRYEQINNAVRFVRRRTKAIDNAVGKAKAVVDLSRERVHHDVPDRPLAAVR